MASAIRSLVAEARWRGLWGTVRAIKMNKMGTMSCYVGEDTFQNRYFEDRTETYGRDRWVEYVDERNPDSLKVEPEWHAWLHHNTDDAPSQHPLPRPVYEKPSSGNPTGTRDAYVPPHHRLSKKFDGNASEKYETWAPQGRKKAEGGKPDSEDKVLDLK
ncbi:NADH:ubiquinone oxidoreductase [Chondrus crispus]|uniref:NADH dehydrogenase [ubiquinone] 1 alpha subcomplex subunit 12 n=1 Tax=Chondrus crispus TaxID=2769 RepID=R7QPI6_CHOCR|nr:NADH:ubiquinone oxidoreductase [Chondrus crispus]CDF39984.1 NADH:ubiquinone oxidoreductase [Chondrus crispus]|eukprot:XP_005710278.1 NADH:ubiquinone oxidoreductase [Chondrus crispus]